MNRKRKYIIFVGVAILGITLSCKSKTVYLNNDVVVMNNDTFDVIVDTHRIVRVTKISPRNILEESSPRYLVKTHLDSSYVTQYPDKIGDKRVFQIFTKRR